VELSGARLPAPEARGVVTLEGTRASSREGRTRGAEGSEGPVRRVAEAESAPNRTTLFRERGCSAPELCGDRKVFAGALEHREEEEGRRGRKEFARREGSPWEEGLRKP